MLIEAVPQILTGDLIGTAKTSGLLIYLILFLIILLENGVPPMIWLPGDSLLFLSGMLAASGFFDLSSLLVVYILAGFFGYQISYLLGSRLGLPLISRHFSRIVTEKNLKQSREFYCRWGNAAITIGRFVPIIRTITPFIAGISRMKINQFTAYNILGAFFWPFTVCGFGFLCGVIPWLASYRDLIFNLVSVLFILSILGSCILILHSWILSR
ncbi:MAG: DedA family protein [Methanospirillum sp.]|uniref:DedA family protein n=1 Tax=Methanospirillum sp. TaxID=45200 RepID=UPI00236ABBC3|nr:DedA family protein [Methanospirillum sp.]MDD1728731.1 DedA family protein [Methanospirillum sp.]